MPLCQAVQEYWRIDEKRKSGIKFIFGIYHSRVVAIFECTNAVRNSESKQINEQDGDKVRFYLKFACLTMQQKFIGIRVNVKTQNNFYL